MVNSFSVQIPCATDYAFQKVKKEMKEFFGYQHVPLHEWSFPIYSWKLVLNWLRKYNFGYLADAMEKSPRYAAVREEWENTWGAMYDLSSAIECSDFEIPMPAGVALKPYQKVAVSYAAAAYQRGEKGVIYAEDMGIGKSAESLAFLNYLKLNTPTERKRKKFRTIIVCPVTLVNNWMREIVKFCWSPGHVMKAPISKDGMADATILIIPYTALAKYKDILGKINFDLAIFDEAHYVKNPTSKRTQLSKSIVDHSRFSLFLTGTPISNRPIDLFMLLHMIDPVRFYSYEVFGRRYCAGKDTLYGFVANGCTNASELNIILRSQYMVRRTKSQVLPELLPKIIEVIGFDKGKYKTFCEREEKYIGGKVSQRAAIEVIRNTKMQDMAELASIRHDLAVAKVPDVCSFIDDVLASEDKVLVFAHHQEVIAAIKAKYGPKSITIVGGMSAKMKDAEEQRFHNDPNVHVAILSIQAAGVGLTLTEARTVIFAELDWTASAMDQAMDRAHRIGQKEQVNVYFLMVEGTFDFHIADMIAEKRKNADNILGVKNNHLEKI